MIIRLAAAREINTIRQIVRSWGVKELLRAERSVLRWLPNSIVSVCVCYEVAGNRFFHSVNRPSDNNPSLLGA